MKSHSIKQMTDTIRFAVFDEKCYLEQDLMDVNSKYEVDEKEIGSGHYGVVRLCTAKGELLSYPGGYLVSHAAAVLLMYHHKVLYGYHVLLYVPLLLLLYRPRTLYAGYHSRAPPRDISY